MRAESKTLQAQEHLQVSTDAASRRKMAGPRHLASHVQAHQRLMFGAPLPVDSSKGFCWLSLASWEFHPLSHSIFDTVIGALSYT